MRANDIEPTGADESVDARARRRLRELRTEQGLTLQQVADRAHLDVSTLSRLESGKRRLALDHLPHLAAALGVTTDDLVGAAPAVDPRVRGEPHEHDGLTMWPLTNRATAGLHAYKIQIHATRTQPPDDLRVHEGHDWLYVVEGRMRLILGAEDLVIEPGEAVEFTTWTPHWFGVVEEPVEVIALLGAHGERLHLHDTGPVT
jgi:transcriptional regulator with XRE-family HTH domain